MPTSGSVNFSVSRNDIINEAAEICGIKDFEESLTANELASCSRTLNMMIKQWHAKGIYLWKSKEVTVFPSYGGYEFDLGPTGDHATLSFTKTEVATAASSGDSTLVVDSATGIATTYNIGIELDDGTLQWTTVNGAPVGTTITLTAALTDDVSVDANVYVYQTIINRPLFVTEARLYHDASDADLPMHPISRNLYKAITQKASTGIPNQYWYDPQTTNGKLYIYSAFDSVKNYLKLTCRMPIEDFDSATDEPDFPQEWFLPLAWNLAPLIAPKFRIVLSGDIQIRAEMMLQEMVDFDKDYASVYFEAE